MIFWIWIHFCMWCSSTWVPEISEVQSGTEISILLFQKAEFVYLDAHLFHTNLEITWAVIIGVVGVCCVYRILHRFSMRNWFSKHHTPFASTFLSDWPFQVYVLTELQDEHTCVVWPLEYTYVHNLRYVSLLLRSNLGNIWLIDFDTLQFLTVQCLFIFATKLQFFWNTF